jgi:hypothetical protein
METNVQRLKRVLLKLHNSNGNFHTLAHDPADLAVFKSLLDAVTQSAAAGASTLAWPAPPVPEVSHTVGH